MISSPKADFLKNIKNRDLYEKPKELCLPLLANANERDKMKVNIEMYFIFNDSFRTFLRDVRLSSPEEKSRISLLRL